MDEEKPGCLMPIAWAAIAALAVCAGGAVLAVAIEDSESAGVAASTWLAGPVGFALAGALAAFVTHFVAKGTGARLAVPVGCGCLGAVGALFATVFFFGAIFPSL
ncbi:MAG: hypothetical protein ACOZNI_29640 [Myxococcota bacterium]